jgi:hypothetical protein
LTRLCWSWALASIWLVWTAQTHAEAGRAQLVLERPAQSFCPTRETIESDVEALAGHPVFSSDPRAALRVRCDISDHASGVSARIEVRDEGGHPIGTRELLAAPGECAALREPIAVVLLMLLDREPEPSESSAADRSGATPFGAGASFGGLAGMLPRADAGFGLVVVAKIREALHVRLDGGYWFPVTAHTSEGRGGNFRAFSLAGALCRSVWQSSNGLGVSLCGGAQLAVIQARARNLLVEHREARALGQGFLTLELSGRWDRSELRADLGPTLAFARPRFYMLQDDGASLDVHRPALLGAIFRIALIIWAP